MTGPFGDEVPSRRVMPQPLFYILTYLVRALLHEDVQL